MGDVKADYKEAISWYKRAASQGCAESQWRYGCMLWNGKGTLKDEKLAKEWIRRAADGGNKAAVKYLRELNSWERDKSNYDGSEAGGALIGIGGALIDLLL